VAFSGIYLAAVNSIHSQAKAVLFSYHFGELISPGIGLTALCYRKQNKYRIEEAALDIPSPRVKGFGEQVL
jgi:hypothetical protein